MVTLYPVSSSYSEDSYDRSRVLFNFKILSLNIQLELIIHENMLPQKIFFMYLYSSVL